VESLRASPATLVILVTENTHFSILTNTFSIQTLSNYLFHYLFSLNIIFQCFFIVLLTPTVFFPSNGSKPANQTNQMDPNTQTVPNLGNPNKRNIN
jgi:hypothetical protein